MWILILLTVLSLAFIIFAGLIIKNQDNVAKKESLNKDFSLANRLDILEKKLIDNKKI